MMNENNLKYNSKLKLFPIGRKIILIFAVLTIVFTGITVSFIGKTLNENSLKRFNRIVPRDLIHISNSFKLFFDNTKSVLNTLSQDEDVKKADDTIHSYVLSTKKIRAEDTIKSEMEKNSSSVLKMYFPIFPNMLKFIWELSGEDMLPVLTVKCLPVMIRVNACGMSLQVPQMVKI